MQPIASLALDRRTLLKGAGALVVTVAAPVEVLAAAMPGAGTGTTHRPPFTPEQLDSWIAVRQDGGVTAFFGKTDSNQGVYVGIGQIVADELDLPFDRVSVVMGDTSRTINQGGASGSTGVQRGGIALRNAAAEARRLLVAMAAEKWNVPAERLFVEDGVILAPDDPKKRISYGALIGGRYFDATLHWNGKLGNPLVVEGTAKPKPPAAYRVVGKPFPRVDITHKVFARFAFSTDVRVPGMLHGQVVRPPTVGATVVTVDEASVRGLPGVVKVVVRKNFVGVVTEKPWQAIQAAAALKVQWTTGSKLPPQPSVPISTRTTQS